MKAKTVLRVVARALPIGALFLPLGTLSINFLIEKLTKYNIVELAKLPFAEDNELFANLLRSDMMAPARPWLYVAVAGLALGILAILAGLALTWGESVKMLTASAAVYAGGVLGTAAMGVGFAFFGSAMGEALMNIASTSLNFGAYVLLGLLLFNLIHSLIQRRDAKERARRAALAAKKRKRR